MSNLPFLQIYHAYKPQELVKSILVGLIYYVLIGGIVVTPTIVISMLYVPFIEYFLLIIYIAISLAGSYASNKVIETLLVYKDEQSLPFAVWQKRFSVTHAALVFVITAIIYLQYLD